MFCVQSYDRTIYTFETSYRECGSEKWIQAKSYTWMSMQEPFISNYKKAVPELNISGTIVYNICEFKFIKK